MLDCVLLVSNYLLEVKYRGCHQTPDYYGFICIKKLKPFSF